MCAIYLCYFLAICFLFETSENIYKFIKSDKKNM